MITVAHLFPDNWFALVVNSKILQALPTFFSFRLPRETNCDGKLAKCNYEFGPQRGSLFATFPPRTTRYFIIIRETPRNELLTKKPAITLCQQSNQSAGGNNLYFPVFDVHYVISMVSYRPKYSTNQRARNRSGIVKIINLISRLQCGGKGYDWYKMRQGEF